MVDAWLLLVCALWCVVCGMWSIALWLVVCGWWFVVGGLWLVVFGSWSVVGGVWSVVSGRWSVVGGLWLVVFGWWAVVSGQWYVVCDLRPVVCGCRRLWAGACLYKAICCGNDGVRPVLWVHHVILVSRVHFDHWDIWRENLRKNEEGQCDTLPMTGGGAGTGPNAFIIVTPTALLSPARGKSMVSAAMGGGGECPMPWKKTGQRPSGNVWRDLRVTVWRMCQNRVQQGTGFKGRVRVPGWLGRTSLHTIAEASHKDAQVRQLRKPFVQLFTLVPRKRRVDVGDDVRCVAKESKSDGTGLAPHGGQLGDVSGYGVVGEELCVRVLVSIGDGEVVAIHSNRPSCMVRSTTEPKLLQGNSLGLFSENLRHEVPPASP